MCIDIYLLIFKMQLVYITLYNTLEIGSTFK